MARIAAHVQAILYVHADDGQDYVHVFGGAEPETKIDRQGREWLRVDNLPRRTNVELATTSRGPNSLSVVHTKGADLSKDFA